VFQSAQPVSEITPIQATTEEPTVPTQASYRQKNAWEKMDLTKQQEFVKSNTGFDPTKYGLSYKSANVQPETIDNKINNKKVKD
jgi:hypothetical protein